MDTSRRVFKLFCCSTPTGLGVCMAACIWLFCQAPLNGQQAESSQQDESEQLRAVVRISWELIDAFADDQVVAQVPFESNVGGGTVSGSVLGKADLTIEHLPDDDADRAVFLVRAQGTARGSFRASSGCIRIAGPLSIPFWAEREIAFDGRYFRAGAASVAASVNTVFSTIRSRRNGPLGRAMVRLATPAIRRQRGSTQAEAAPVARQRVATFIDNYTAQVVRQLNEVTPIEKSLLKLYPEMADWRVRVRDSGDYLEARYAPIQSEPVQLPQIPHPDAGIEIWIRTTIPEARFLERVGGWQQTQGLLKNYLPDEGSDAGKLTSETSVKSYGPWLAVLIGRVQDADATRPAPSE